MRAVLRWTAVLLAGGSWLLPAGAIAQQAAPSTSSAPATEVIGPSELRNFSLPGTRTRPAEQPAAPAPVAAPATVPPVREAPPRPRDLVNREVPKPARTVTTATVPVRQAPATSQAIAPGPDVAAAPTPWPLGAPVVAPAAVPRSEPLPKDRILSLIPWLVAGFLLAGASLFFWRQRRLYPAPAGGAEFDLFAGEGPEPAPLPPVRQEPRPAPPAGIVSSRLRPSLEIAVQPLRCVVDDKEVTIEFELDLFNAGSAPARAILAEASLFNPGASQERELSAFFSRPAGAGNRLDAIPPLKRITLTSQVVAPRAAIHEFELAGRKSLVPVLAFNAVYEWSGGKGQTSAAFLVGREGGGERLGPVRLDAGRREVRGLGARALPTALRT